MNRRHFFRRKPHDRAGEPRPRRRIRLIPLLLMVIGAATVFVLAARYVIVPLLVYLGGN